MTKKRQKNDQKRRKNTIFSRKIKINQKTYIYRESKYPKKRPKKRQKNEFPRSQQRKNSMKTLRLRKKTPKNGPKWPQNRKIKKNRNITRFPKTHIKTHKNTLFTHIYTLGRVYIHEVGTRICTSIWDAYMYVNLGRVYVHQFGTRIHTIRTTSTLINSSFGTRIGTSIWDAYPYTKLGRVYVPQFGTPIRDAYTKLGRIYVPKYTQIYKIHTQITQNYTK